MASRLRLFVKKRGTRSTRTRWQGMLGELLLSLSLIAVGTYGLYWLFSGVLLAEGSRHGWWPWFAIIIPIALLGYGATSLVALLWQSTASQERRAAVVRKATDWELPVGEPKSGCLSLPAVPPYSAIVESPGVRLAYRLPIDAASGWMSFTMAAVCLVWNTFVAVFVYHVVQQHIEGHPQRWLFTWLTIPFVMAASWTLVALFRQVLLDIIVGTTRIEVSTHPLYPGSTAQALVLQTGRSHMRLFQVQVVCEEQAVYQQGTDTRRAVQQVFSETVFSQRKFDISPEHTFENTFDVSIPDSAMHSFVSNHNAVNWSIIVRGRTRRFGEFERRFPIYVYPAAVSHHEQIVQQPTLAARS